jgi:hypothetical protein
MKQKTKTKTRGAKQPIRLVKKPGSNAVEPMLTMPQAIRYTGRTYCMLYKATVNGTLECQQAGPGRVMFFSFGALNTYLSRTKSGAPLSK